LLLTHEAEWPLLLRQIHVSKNIPMRIFTISFVLAAAAIGLSSCQTMTSEERRAADERQCLSYGFRRGSDGFATCLQRIDLDRREQSRINSQELMWDMSNDLNRPVYFGPRHYRRY
jgi:hypothetical protein